MQNVQSERERNITRHEPKVTHSGMNSQTENIKFVLKNVYVLMRIE